MSTFVGRSALLDELVAACRDAREEGRGAVFLLEGDAGIGKTTLAQHAARAAGAQGLSVSWGTSAPDGSAPPFWPWSRLADLRALQDRAGRPRGASDAIGAARFEILSALADEIVRIVADRPTLHLIEDLQWADVASLLLLADLATGIEHTSLVIIATLRSGESLTAPLSSAVEGVRRTARVRELAAFDDADVAAAMEAAGIAPDPAFVSLVSARTGGNPLFVTELLRVAALRRSTTTASDALAAEVPHGVSDLVERRVARLPTEVGNLLGGAAVLGPVGETHVLSAVCDIAVVATLDLLEQARAAHMMTVGDGRWQFRHEIVRDAVYERIPPAERARWHTRALDELSRDPTSPPAILATHALAALPLLDADRAVALAARAGEAAFNQVAYEEAVGWFEQAVRAAPATSATRWRAELLVLSGEAHRHMGDTDSARHAFRAAGALADDAPALLARAALGYADPGADLGIAYRSVDGTTADLLERAFAAQPPEDSVTRVFLEARLAAELCFSEVPDRPRALAANALEMARRLGDPRALVAATAVHHDAFVVGQRDVDERLRSSEQMLDWARAAGTPHALLTAHRARVFDLLAAGDLDAMQREVVAFRHIADPLRVPAYDWWPALWAAMGALLQGEHAEAEALASHAHEIGARPFGASAFLNLSFLLFFLRREQGRFAELESTMREFAVANADIPSIRVALIFLLAELGRHDEAAGLLADIDDDALVKLHDRNWPASWFQLARTCFLLGDRTHARRFLELGPAPERCVTVSLATACLGASDLAVAWLQHAAGELDAADESYRRAEAQNGRLNARSWLAQARVDHALLLAERDGPDDRPAAGALLDLAGASATAIGMPLVAAAVEDLRGRLADSPVAPGMIVEDRTGSFHRAGDVWELRFADRLARVPHARGLSDIAVLLSRPGVAVPAVELLGAEEGTEPSRVRGAPALDERARREIQGRIRDLDAEIDDAEAAHDLERAARARDERQAIAAAVVKDLGLGGRVRRLDDPIERARKTVSTRMRRTIARLERDHPELARHLERSIDTGTWCAYRPAEPMTWEF